MSLPVPQCFPASLPWAHYLAVQQPTLNSSSVCVSHSLSSSNAGIPAVRPNNKGCAPCLWTITSSACPYKELCIAETHKKGVCLLVCVAARSVHVCVRMSERVSDSPEVTVEAADVAKLFLHVCNVWNIWRLCQCSGGTAVGEDRQGVWVTLFPPGSCQHLSFMWTSREKKRTSQS